MILPIVAYGHPTLRKVGVEITKDYPNLKELIANMWDTLYKSNGVGLAAPQINHAIRLFLVDSLQIVEGADDEDKDDYKHEKPIKAVFINPTIVELDGDDWKYNEGCLSIPKIREDVSTARIIPHEYDHIEGILFIDHLKPLKRRLLKAKLDDISRGKIKVDYKMLFPK